MCKLRECPFCGSNDVSVRETEIDGETVYFLLCDFCNAIAGAAKDKQTVIEKWNAREEIYSCPFCGGKGLMTEIDCEGEKYFAVICETCGVSGGACEDEARAISAWNHRI
ncbi:MAG: Lar family restriction alleviation protein [Synergistaceae bacterium]|nr:Lar family restriction alleviation protein [Synergistaceae bacterium]